jgi:hemoglobin/transferrin/lactoferrin receptor protein
VKGVEVQARYRVADAWVLFGNMTWIDGEVDAYPNADGAVAREPLDRMMPITMYMGARWNPDATAYWLEALLGIADEQSELSSRDLADTDRIPPGGTPGYATVTLRGGWAFSERLNLSLSIENIFNEDYRVHGSGLNEPGRNVVVSIFWQ